MASLGCRFNSSSGAPVRWAIGTTIVAVMYVVRNMIIKSQPAARSCSAAWAASWASEIKPTSTTWASNCPRLVRHDPGRPFELGEQLRELGPIGAEAAGHRPTTGWGRREAKPRLSSDVGNLNWARPQSRWRSRARVQSLIGVSTLELAEKLGHFGLPASVTR